MWLFNRSAVHVFVSVLSSSLLTGVHNPLSDSTEIKRLESCRNTRSLLVSRARIPEIKHFLSSKRDAGSLSEHHSSVGTERELTGERNPPTPGPRMHQHSPLVTHSAVEQDELNDLAQELELTPMQVQFVHYLASGQAPSAAAAARLAGYKDTSAKQSAWQLQQQKGVRTYLRACVRANMQMMQVRAAQVLQDVMNDTSESGEVRSKVAFGILDRSGLGKGNGSGAAAGGQAVQVNIVLEKRDV